MRSAQRRPERLADFIRDNHEPILKAWEAFARTLLPAAEGMSKALLRDHAEEILQAIVLDMRSLQTAAQKQAKSRGREAKVGPASKRLAALGQLHAVLRIESGFTLAQVVAEYRALRASVFRLWAKEGPDPDGELRFNEAIDEALAEAVDRYSKKTSEYRDQLLGIVSHDLRNPLASILMGATVLGRNDALDDKSARIASGIQSSARRMFRIVGDLLDLTRTRLGSEISIVRAPVDVGPICELVIAELEGSHPKATIRYKAVGDLRGSWDADRLAQVLSNLVGNALQHGDAGRPIDVVARGEERHVVLSVNNAGPPIPKAVIGDIFEPMVRHVRDELRSPSGLGLGLYIARELVRAHGGTLGVTSTAASGTSFSVRLPRNLASKPKTTRGQT
jgi:signal transduction histidine kinase